MSIISFVICFLIIVNSINLYYYFKNNNVEIVFWNILCEALGKNQFLTNGGDEENINWEKRKHKVCKKIEEQLQNGRIVSCVEVDNYPYILNYLKKNNKNLNINGIYMPKINKEKGNSNNNLSIYITTLLNSYDNFVEIVPNLKGYELNEAYINLTNYYKKDRKNYPSFADNYTPGHYLNYLKILLNMELTDNMPYVSFDCSVILWSENDYNVYNVFYPENDFKPYNQDLIMKNFDDYYNFNNIHEDGFMGLRFSKNNYYSIHSFNCYNMFDVFVAHIKSGENANSEFQRVKSCRKILNIINDYALDTHVICMDSNTGSQYEKSINKGIIENKKGEKNVFLNMYLSELINYYDYKNVIKQNKDTICWKIRTGSEQKDKNGVLMADTIDKIIVRSYIDCEQLIPYKSNITKNDYNYINMWRNTNYIRELFKYTCNKNNWDINIKNNNLEQIFCDELINLKYKKNNKNNSIEKVTNILNKLYPNEDNPSDHPMVGIKIYI